MNTSKVPSIPPVSVNSLPKPKAKRPKRRRWPWALAILAVVAGGGVYAQRAGARPAPIDPASLVTVTRKPLEVDILETGRISPREKADIKSRIPGQVQAVRVREGDIVKQGDVLIALDPTDYQRDYAKSEADVAQATSALEFAELTKVRAERGVAEGVAPRFELDQTASDTKTRASSLKAADVARTIAQDHLRYTKIVSPIGGTVIARNIDPGESVIPGVQSTFDGKPLLTIADLSVLLVKVNLNQIDVAKVAVGKRATLTLDALPGKKYTAVVTKVAPASVKLTGKDQEVFPVEAQLDEADGVVKPGMTADVRVHLDAKPNVLVLPLEAIVKDQGKSYVMKMVGAAPQKTEVTVGLRNDREVEVLNLDEGTRVQLKPPSASENEVK